MTKPIVVLVVFGLCLSACGAAKEGDMCQDGQPQCENDHIALFCDNGHYVANNCPGPNGCTGTTVGSQPVVECDIRGTRSGDECVSAFAGLVFCQSAETALICGGDIWRAETCTQPCQDGQPDVGGGGDPGICQ